MIDKNNLVYFFYFIIVLTTFSSDLDILPTNYSFPLVLLSLLVLIVAFFLTLQNINIKKLVIISFFSFLILISSFLNMDSSPNLTRILLLSIFYPVTFFLSAQIVRVNSIKRVLLPFFICMVFVLILTIISTLGFYDFEFYGSNLDYYDEVYARDRILAVNGIYLNQNSFASILIIAVYTFLIMLINSSYKKYKVIFFVLLLLSLSMLLLTLARAPIISVTIGLIVFVLFSPIKKRIKIFSLLVFITGILVFTQTDYYELFLDKVSSAGLSHRDIIWNNVIENISENKLIGVGLGNYSFIDGYQSYSTHNVYLFLLVSLGLIGSAGIFLGLLIIIFLIIYNILYNYGNKMSVIFSSVVIAVLLHQVFEVGLDNPLKPLSLFFIISVAYLNYFRKNT